MQPQPVVKQKTLKEMIQEKMPTVEKLDSELSEIQKKSSNMNKTPSFDNLTAQ